MNNIRVLTGIVLSLLVAKLNAQNYQDIIRYSLPQYSGTARSMAMGNAFGSLGGDYSAIGINPAGIATYRSSEFSFTPSLIVNSTESDFDDRQITDNKTTFAFNQIGYVGTYRPMREVKKGIVSSHFAIGYNRNNNFNYSSMAISPTQKFSLTDIFIEDAYGISPEALGKNNNLTSLAFNSFVIDHLGKDGNGFDNYSAFLADNNTVDQIRALEKKGYSGEINLTAGTNISNIILLGASINYSTLNYEQSFQYIEEFSANNEIQHENVFQRYTIGQNMDVSGNGVNLKVGVILKPIKHLRLGFSYHTPTWYNIQENYTTKINASFFNTINNSYDTYAYTDGKAEYEIRTPEKLIGSISYIIGKVAILSFDYEMISYNSAKFKATSSNEISYFEERNEEIKIFLTTTHNLRAGTEIRLNKQISVRGGYSLQPSPYKESPFEFEQTSISGGLGYRNKNYFIDLAYKNTNYDASHIWYPSVNEDLDPETEYVGTTSTDHYASVTIGWKF